MIKRDLAKQLKKNAKYFPIISVLVPRQSGKTTLVQSVFSKHVYVSLENPDIREAIRKDPRTFFTVNKNKHGIIIDEFQHIPELISYIQVICDEEKKPGYFILSGSQSFLMNQNITQSLAGRISINILLPLSIGELDNAGLLPTEVEEILYKGCYPAIYSLNVPPYDLYSNYLQTYIERDVRLLSNIGDASRFHTFVTLCASRVGQLVNFSALAQECGVSDKTVTRWLGILEASYIIYLLHPHHKTLGKRLVKSQKLYFYDPGLVCYLLKLKKSDLATHPVKSGLFEGFIIMDILKYFHNTGRRPTIYFWQDKLGHEVDCLIQQGLEVIPVDIKANRTPNERFFDGLKYRYALEDGGPHEGFVVYSESKKEIGAYKYLISWQMMREIYKTIK
jgi:predicted AAA+ superfamily ATPase